MSENRKLGRIFGIKEEEVIGGWRQLHTKYLFIICELHKILFV